ncbi:MAG TPA: glutathione S-transferase family protein [Xanthobacteraceae bacterium]|nr:glutathione S-transferase family protein [Xanthobacteraceae bacterium]
MSEFVVYNIPGSPFGRAVLATLEEKGASYRLSPVAPGTMRGEPHISRHPFGRVPVLEHNGFMLYETQAILRYLDRMLPAPPLTPKDPKAAARMDQAMNVNDWYLFQGVNNIIGFHRVVGPRVMGLTPDETAIAAAMPKAHVVCNELARLLGPQPYFAGDAVTLADLLLAPQLDFLAQTPEWAQLSAGNRNLVDWLDRMNARASLRATTWERVADMANAA